MLLAVQLRADAVEIFEGLGEGQGVVVADLTGDLLDRVIGLDQARCNLHWIRYSCGEIPIFSLKILVR